MSNALDEFFKKNRQELDSEIPDERIWRGIEQRYAKTRRDSLSMVWRAAAVFFFATTVGLAVLQLKSNQDLQRSYTDITFTQTENFYAEQIKLRENWLADLGTGTTIDFSSEYDRLMAMYQVLRIQWEQHPTPEIRDALTLNLIVRLDLLTKQVDLHNRTTGSTQNQESTTWQ